MKAKFFTIFLLTPLISMAQLPVGEIENLNANYRSPSGSGSAKFIKLNEFGDYENPSLSVENYNGLLIFGIEDKSFELDISMLGVSDVESLFVNNLNFLNDKKVISLDLESLNIEDPTLKSNVTNPQINCHRSVNYENAQIDILKNCLQNSEFLISSAYFESEEANFENLIDSNSSASNKFDLNSFKLNINSGRFRGEVKSSMSAGLTIKVEGLSNFKIDTNTIEIKLEKAKAGIFNIRSKIFDELKKIESSDLLINEPFITIQLKD